MSKENSDWEMEKIKANAQWQVNKWYDYKQQISSGPLGLKPAHFTMLWSLVQREQTCSVRFLAEFITHRASCTNQLREKLLSSACSYQENISKNNKLLTYKCMVYHINATKDINLSSVKLYTSTEVLKQQE